MKGSQHPEQVVIVSGHLDSWDLATGLVRTMAAGVGIAMQVMSVIKSLGLRPSRTLWVIAWANEENGLEGGVTYEVAIGESFQCDRKRPGAGAPPIILRRPEAATDPEAGFQSARGFGCGTGVPDG